jgi:cell division protein FtsL
MKNPLTVKKADAKVQDLQSVVLIIVSVAFIVLASVVAVLFAQGLDHRKSINDLKQSVSELKSSE